MRTNLQNDSPQKFRPTELASLADFLWCVCFLTWDLKGRSADWSWCPPSCSADRTTLTECSAITHLSACDLRCRYQCCLSLCYSCVVYRGGYWRRAPRCHKATTGLQTTCRAGELWMVYHFTFPASLCVVTFIISYGDLNVFDLCELNDWNWISCVFHFTCSGMILGWCLLVMFAKWRLSI